MQKVGDFVVLSILGRIMIENVHNINVISVLANVMMKMLMWTIFVVSIESKIMMCMFGNKN